MATALLRVKQADVNAIMMEHKWTCGSKFADIEEARELFKSHMTFGRDTPPPQLPQIPQESWSRIWDEFVEFAAQTTSTTMAKQMQTVNKCKVVCGIGCLLHGANCAYGAANGGLVCLGVGSDMHASFTSLYVWMGISSACVCGAALSSVGSMNWQIQARLETEQQFSSIADRASAELAPYGVGVSVNYEMQQPVGIAFNGAVMAPAQYAMAAQLAAPAAIQMAGAGGSKFCSSCGAPLPEGVRFCNNCGASVPVSNPEMAKPLIGGEGVEIV